jgi:hypothetical protein
LPHPVLLSEGREEGPVLCSPLLSLEPSPLQSSPQAQAESPALVESSSVLLTGDLTDHGGPGAAPLLDGNSLLWVSQGSQERDLGRGFWYAWLMELVFVPKYLAQMKLQESGSDLVNSLKTLTLTCTVFGFTLTSYDVHCKKWTGICWCHIEQWKQWL